MPDKICDIFKIALYSDPITELRTDPLSHALKRDLSRTVQGMRTQLIPVYQHDFAHVASHVKPDVIFIPENIHSVSHHMRDFSRHIIDTLKEYAYDGGTLVMFGGASHYAMKNIVWYWDEGVVRYKGPKETFALVNGTLTGPHHIHTNEKLRFNGCFQVPLSIPTHSGQDVTEMCWQGNSGEFDINLSHHAGTEILAFHKDVEGQYIAAANVPVGNKGGNIILCSTMPHYRPRNESPLWDKILSNIECKKTRSHTSRVIKNTP
jgi:hypothetical protein